MNRKPLDESEIIEEEAASTNRTVGRMATSSEELKEEAEEPVFIVEKVAVPPDQRFQFFTQSFPPIAVCWLILLVIMGLRIHFSSVISENNAKLMAGNQQLNTQNQELEDKIQELYTQNKKLNTQIKKLETQKNNLTEQIQNMRRDGNIRGAQWSIDAYCPRVNDERHCKPCQDGWRYLQVSCFAINNPDLPKWKTWEKARENCKGKTSDLAVIDNAAEKRIITPYSWNSSGTNGYWIGLRVEDGRWMWVNGSDLTETSWIEAPTDGHCAISVQDLGWRSVPCSNKNRWICKKKALSV